MYKCSEPEPNACMRALQNPSRSEMVKHKALPARHPLHAYGDTGKSPASKPLIRKWHATLCEQVLRLAGQGPTDAVGSQTPLTQDCTTDAPKSKQKQPMRMLRHADE